jgi:hypothetical protein
MLQIVVMPDEHAPGRAIVGEADPGALTSMGYEQYDMIPGPTEPPDPLRSGSFDGYTTDTGVYAAGIKGARRYVASWINPYQKNATKNNYNENVNHPIGKPDVIFDNRGRVLDGRTQYPGQQTFRYDTNIPRPAYMSFSDLLDQEGVY